MVGELLGMLGEAGPFAWILWISMAAGSAWLWYRAGWWCLVGLRSGTWPKIGNALGRDGTESEGGRPRGIEQLIRELGGWRPGGAVGAQQTVLAALSERFQLLRRGANLLVLAGLAGTIFGFLFVTIDLSRAFSESTGSAGIDEAVLADAMSGLLVAFASTLVGAVGAAVTRLILILAEVRARRGAATLAASMPSYPTALDEGSEELGELRKQVGDAVTRSVAGLGEVTVLLNNAVKVFSDSMNGISEELGKLFARHHEQLKKMFKDAGDEQKAQFERAAEGQRTMLKEARRETNDLLNRATECAGKLASQARLASDGVSGMSQATNKLTAAANEWQNQMVNEHRSALAEASKGLREAFEGAERRAVSSWEAAAGKLEGIGSPLEKMVEQITAQSNTSTTASDKLQKAAEAYTEALGPLEESLTRLQARAEIMKKGVKHIGELLRDQDERP